MVKRMKEKKIFIGLIVVLLMILIVLTILLSMTKLVKKENEDISNSVNNNIQSIQNQIDDNLEQTQQDYAAIPFRDVSDETMTITYLSDFQNNVKNNIQVAYNTLEPEYAQKRFGNISNFQSYVQQKIDQISKAYVKKYQVIEQDGYNRYICMDQFENYYIFKETAIMQYTIVLDEYTIVLPEYEQNYKKSSDGQKVSFNVNRFLKILKDENYSLAYSFLAQSFKNNYFPNLESFANYAKQNLVGKSEISSSSLQTEGELLILNAIISNPLNSNDKIQKNFVVKLKEGTGFELSFGV